MIFTEIKPGKPFIISYFECKSWPTNTFGRGSLSSVRKVLERTAVHYLYLAAARCECLSKEKWCLWGWEELEQMDFCFFCLTSQTKRNDSLKNSGNVFIPVQGEELRRQLWSPKLWPSKDPCGWRKGGELKRTFLENTTAFKVLKDSVWTSCWGEKCLEGQLEKKWK